MEKEGSTRGREFTVNDLKGTARELGEICAAYLAFAEQLEKLPPEGGLWVLGGNLLDDSLSSIRFMLAKIQAAYYEPNPKRRRRAVKHGVPESIPEKAANTRKTDKQSHQMSQSGKRSKS